MNLTEKSGPLAAQLLAHDQEDLLIITTDGTVIRTPVSAISVQGRATQGVRLMRVDEDTKVICVARAEAEPEELDEEIPEEAIENAEATESTENPEEEI